MNYQIITKQQYHNERKNILEMVKELFKNDNSKIVNLKNDKSFI